MDLLIVLCDVSCLYVSSTEKISGNQLYRVIAATPATIHSPTHTSSAGNLILSRHHENTNTSNCSHFPDSYESNFKMAFSSVFKAVAFLAVAVPAQAFAPASSGVKTVSLIKIRRWLFILSEEKGFRRASK